MGSDRIMANNVSKKLIRDPAGVVRVLLRLHRGDCPDLPSASNDSQKNPCAI
jgi:hypothetical protein